MRGSMSRPPKKEKAKRSYDPLKNTQNQGQDGYKHSQSSSSRNPLEVYGTDADFTLFKSPVDHVFSALQDKS